MTTSTRELGRQMLRLPARQKALLVWRVLRDDRVPLGAKLVFPALAAYLATPIDLVPDFIPVLGQLDDVLVAAAALWLFVRLCPREILAEHLTELAAEASEPRAPALSARSSFLRYYPEAARERAETEG